MIKNLFIIFIFYGFLYSQPISYNPQFNSPKHKIDLERSLISGGMIAISVISIYHAGKPIYYNESQSKFHFTRNSRNELELFDNGHRGMDKFGHIFSTSLFAQNIYFLSRWSGFENNGASWTSFILASSIMGAMEVHDAYYERWGFTIGDFMANLAGASLIVGQYNIPFLRNFDYKMSYDFTHKAAEEAVIESYPNMTFWLSANPSGLFEKDLPDWFPNWLNVAVGISTTQQYPHKRELLIGIDYNLKRINTSSAFLRHLIVLLDRYKLPAPAIRLAPGFIGYGLYF
jgi:hypothetical protein